MPRSLLLRFAILLSLSAASAFAQSFTFTHFAGTNGGRASEDGIGTAARFHGAQHVAVDGAGNIYVADATDHTIRKITADGVASTLAGLAGSPGFTDGTGGAARFYSPSGLTVAADGTLFVTELGNEAVRRVTSAGTVTTIAGSGWFGHTDGVGGAARFDGPGGIAVAEDGTLYVCDTSNHTVRKITSSGVVTTLAGLARTRGHRDGSGSAARFTYPYGIAIDSSGILYVADRNAIRRITPAGAVTTIAGDAQSGSANGTGNAARFNGPIGAAIDGSGNVVVADTYNHTIRKVTPGGEVTTLAGLAGASGAEDGTGEGARFNLPIGVAVDGVGNVIVATDGAIRRITSAGVVTTIAGMSPAVGVTDGNGSEARFDRLQGLAIDHTDTLFVSDSERHTIRKITSSGLVSTYAGLAGQAGSQNGTGASARFNVPLGVAADADGSLLVADLFNYAIRRIAPDRSVTTAIASSEWPSSVAVDGAAVRYFSNQDHTIWKVDAAGTVTILAGSSDSPGSDDGTGSAARFYYPDGLAVDALGNVYVADTYNHTIRKITTSGVVTTIAGLAFEKGAADGTGSAARFSYPRGLSIGNDGNLYVADSGSSTIRKVTPDGVVTTVGGLAFHNGSSDGTGNVARFYGPSSVHMDSAGNLFVTDTYNRAIRKGSPSLPDAATIDSPIGPIGAARQLGTSASTATSWHWDLLRRPANSVAELSSTSISNPVFIPDVADLYVFRLTASNANGSSITTVSLTSGAATTTTLAVSANSSSCAQTRTITATVASAVAGTVEGSVTFKENGVPIGNVALNQGQATMTLSLAPGLHSFTAEYNGNSTHLSSSSATDIHQVATETPAVPTAFSAVATSTSRVLISWTGNPCAAYYQVRRSLNGVPFSFLVNTSDELFEDSGLTPGTTYLYVVRAVNSAGASADTAPDGATTVAFTDDPLIPSVTKAKAVHVTELRAAINAFRASAGLAAFGFSEVVASGTSIRVSHIVELRTAFDAARSSLGLPPMTYTDATITAGATTIRAVHLNELRSAVQ